MESRESRTEIDPFTLLSAMWVFACNDEKALISYRGVRHRLGLPQGYPVEEIVRSRAELFRLRAPSSQLSAYKEKLRSENKGPTWLQAAKTPEERLREIDALQPSDYFRSQFRTEPDAPRSTLEVLKWGLEHIERLRTVHESRRQERRQWITGILVPLLSVGLAFGTLGFTVYFNQRSMNQQTALKRYEVTFKPKQEAYAQFTRQAYGSYRAAADADRAETLLRLGELETTLHALEPFVDASARRELWHLYNEFNTTVLNVLDTGGIKPSDTREVTQEPGFAERRAIARALYAALFGDEETRPESAAATRRVDP